ncbi:MAG: DoxX family protein [Pyrinomonadaceae bacterium]|nr:DoxX family protein [Pyrinomonadaceae bacterium]
MSYLFGHFLRGRGSVGFDCATRFRVGMVLHGSQKIGAPLTWMNAFAGENAPPGFLQALAAVAEFFGGLGLILGLLTPVAALGVACVMVVAIGMAHLPSGHPFINAPGQPSYESAAAYLAVALLLIVTGPGALSLDWLLFGRRARLMKHMPLVVPERDRLIKQTFK